MTKEVIETNKSLYFSLPPQYDQKAFSDFLAHLLSRKAKDGTLHPDFDFNILYADEIQVLKEHNLQVVKCLVCNKYGFYSRRLTIGVHKTIKTIVSRNSCFVHEKCMEALGYCEECRLRVLKSTLLDGGILSSNKKSKWYCEKCIKKITTYCKSCKQLIDNETIYEHIDHKVIFDSNNCMPYNFTFKMKLQNSSILKNDEIIKVDLSKEIIAENNIERIYRKILCPFLYEQQNCSFIEADNIRQTLKKVDPVWVNNRGKLPKRISKLIKEEFDITLPSEILTSIGNIGREYCESIGTYYISFTRNFTHSKAYYCNDKSCWWQNNKRKLCVFKHLGGIAMLFWSKEKIEPVGRCWILPVYSEKNKHIPVIDTELANSYVAFNFYSHNDYKEIRNLVPVHILANLFGLSYGSINKFEIKHCYVNNAKAYLVASSDIVNNPIIMNNDNYYEQNWIIDFNPGFEITKNHKDNFISSDNPMVQPHIREMIVSSQQNSLLTITA